MAKPNKLLELEQQHGNLERIIPPLVNRGGQKLAAAKLKTTQATISRWLKDNNYGPSTTWSKKTTASEKGEIDAAVERVNAHRRAEGLPELEAESEEQAS